MLQMMIAQANYLEALEKHKAGHVSDKELEVIYHQVNDAIAAFKLYMKKEPSRIVRGFKNG